MPIETKICVVSKLAGIITYTKFRSDSLRNTILQQVEFFFFLLISCMGLIQQCRATALPVIIGATTMGTGGTGPPNF